LYNTAVNLNLTGTPVEKELVLQQINDINTEKGENIL
jgi:hypothetical protein